MGKLRVGILAGGRSAEHEVSLQSAKNVLDALDRERFVPVLIGIDKAGRWLLENEHDFLVAGKDGTARLNEAGIPVVLAPHSSGALVAPDGKTDMVLDVVFPILHGPFGEDGTVQGLLKLAELPFVGPSVLGSAVGMDKDVMKRLLLAAGIRIGKFIALGDSDAPLEYGEVVSRLGAPFFIKPANMGSSVGVNKVHDESEYTRFLAEAFLYDRKVILEEFIDGREIECAVLEDGGIIASPPGEVVSTHEFYSYEAKYLDENGAALEIPAKLEPQVAAEVQRLAIASFKALCCEGLSRVDFFLDKNAVIYVNEINTMPGFTKISMYPKLFGAADISYTALITRLITAAVNRFEKEKKLKTTYL